MKTRTSPIWILGLVLPMAWLPVGLAQNEIDRTPNSARDATPLLAVLSPTPEPALATNIPSRIPLSPWTAEVVKLARAGIEDSVMLSFIDNSGMFNLGAEQIIYLSDLGVSSEIVSEMLRHDAEVIAGVRRLTIASEPPRDASIQITFAAGSPASARANMQPATMSDPPALANSQSAVVPEPEPLPEAGHVAINSKPSVFEFATADERRPSSSDGLGQQAHSPKEKGTYPVREPYPVPLTAPIFFVQAAERTPNTIVIELFPRTDH